MLKGLTVQYLVRRTYRVEQGDVVLVHAAAGATGPAPLPVGEAPRGHRHRHRELGRRKPSRRAQPGRRTSSSTARGISSPPSARVTNGEGCAVVYESIGKDTFRRSLDCLRPLGMMASYGHASGPPDPVDVIELGARGSLFLTRPAIMHYLGTRDALERGGEELFDVLGQGVVQPAVNHVYPLSEAAEAHRALEARETTGATVFLPWA